MTTAETAKGFSSACASVCDTNWTRPIAADESDARTHRTPKALRAKFIERFSRFREALGVRTPCPEPSRMGVLASFFLSTVALARVVVAPAFFHCERHSDDSEGLATAKLAGSGGGAGSGSSYHPSMPDRALSPHRCGEASRLLVSEAPRSGFGAREPRSVEFVVLLDIDLPFAMLPLPAAWLLLAAFGLGRVRHFAAPSNRRLFEDRSRSVPERP
jgi:hypothetical protein